MKGKEQNLIYNDTRRFGAMDLVKSEAVLSCIAEIVPATLKKATARPVTAGGRAPPPGAERLEGEGPGFGRGFGRGAGGFGRGAATAAA